MAGFSVFVLCVMTIAEMKKNGVIVFGILEIEVEIYSYLQACVCVCVCVSIASPNLVG